MVRKTFTKTELAGLAAGLLILASAALAASPTAPDEIAPASDPAQGAECLSPVPDPAAPEGEPLLTSDTGGVVYTAGGCSAWASCDDGSTVHCSSSSSSGTCSYQDSNCPGTRGHVTCDGFTTWCPRCEEEIDCSQYNYPGCSYFWNGVLGCCDVKALDGKICLQAC